MPSFDVVSEVDMHELDNAVDQTNREITNRFDFKGSNSSVTKQDNVLVLESGSEFQINQILDILRTRLVKRGIDILCLDVGKVEEVGSRARLQVTVREGLEKDLARKIVKIVKDKKLKVQAAIQGEQVRVTGKKRDDLQNVIAALKEMDLGMPLQFVNFRD
jgi:uncharacterized protein YajQ (UPF0234 family)